MFAAQRVYVNNKAMRAINVQCPDKIVEPSSYQKNFGFWFTDLHIKNYSIVYRNSMSRNYRSGHGAQTPEESAGQQSMQNNL